MIKELQKEKILCRKKDPLRSSVLGCIIDLAKKIAKEDNREANENDIIVSAKRNSKSLHKVVDDTMKELGIRKNDSMLVNYLKEIVITDEFIPPTIDSTIVLAQVTDLVSELLPEQNTIKASMGKIMGKLKAEFGSDLNVSEASKFVKEALK